MNATSSSATPDTTAANPAVAADKSAVKVAAKPAVKPAAKAASEKKPPVKATRKTTAKTPKSKPRTAQAAPLSPPAAPNKATPNKAKTSTAKDSQAKALDKKKTATPVKAAKEKKVKVVRDSFTLPKTELMQITEMKKRAMALGVEVKKSELIRAGLQALASMADTAFKKAMSNVPTIKTGRPAKD